MTSYKGGLKINVESEKHVLEVLETSGGAKKARRWPRLPDCKITTTTTTAQQGIQVALSSFMARTGSLAPQTHAIIRPKRPGQ